MAATKTMVEGYRPDRGILRHFQEYRENKALSFRGQLIPFCQQDGLRDATGWATKGRTKAAHSLSRPSLRDELRDGTKNSQNHYSAFIRPLSIASLQDALRDRNDKPLNSKVEAYLNNCNPVATGRVAG